MKNYIVVVTNILMLPLILGATGYLEASQPVVGRRVARYFSSQSPNEEEDFQSKAGNSRWLTVHLGSYIASRSYLWGSTQGDQQGRANYGVTYLLDQWKGMDRSLRVEFLEYVVNGEIPRQLVILPLFTFPMFESGFPAYFGLGAGLGVFFHQLKGDSELAFHYQLVTGLRFYQETLGAGAFVELSIKNHLHLFSDGQFNGTALNGGLFFIF
ncbi:MAG: hypothetical protein NZ480_06845 [Bdellovibrionaceae bacterium]|nr:hypothetical protein [Pseudobdellovibrionaceae bacterium]MDW8190313.1 hypothetical protein [Pseudobdellovibrionaceae bacterium]